MMNNNNNNDDNNDLKTFTERATIKGILALIIGGGGFIVLLILSVLGQAEAIETLKSILLMIIGFYFGETTAKSK